VCGQRRIKRSSNIGRSVTIKFDDAIIRRTALTAVDRANDRAVCHQFAARLNIYRRSFRSLAYVLLRVQYSKLIDLHG